MIINYPVEVTPELVAGYIVESDMLDSYLDCDNPPWGLVGLTRFIESTINSLSSIDEYEKDPSDFDSWTNIFYSTCEELDLNLNLCDIIDALQEEQFGE